MQRFRYSPGVIVVCFLKYLQKLETSSKLNFWEQPAIVPYIGFEQYAGEKFKVRDLWAKKDLDSDIDKDFVIGVDAHCVKLFRVYPQK
ncbi:MAG: hypothetical protein J6W81_05845 [Lentisphaeria bacterium]|nr:hypothetical protein [Lentisphaeria bacterium]